MTEITELITPNQAAKELGLKYGQVMRAIRSKKIKALKIGWNWFIQQEEVDRYRGQMIDANNQSS